MIWRRTTPARTTDSRASCKYPRNPGYGCSLLAGLVFCCGCFCKDSVDKWRNHGPKGSLRIVARLFVDLGAARPFVLHGAVSGRAEMKAEGRWLRRNRLLCCSSLFGHCITAVLYSRDVSTRVVVCRECKRLREEPCFPPTQGASKVSFDTVHGGNLLTFVCLAGWICVYQDYIVDPLAEGMWDSMSLLRAPFANPGVLKVRMYSG